MKLRDILETTSNFPTKDRVRQVRRDRDAAEKAQLKADGKYRDGMTGEIHDLDDFNSVEYTVIRDRDGRQTGVGVYPTEREANIAAKEYKLKNNIRDDSVYVDTL